MNTWYSVPLMCTFIFHLYFFLIYSKLGNKSSKLNSKSTICNCLSERHSIGYVFWSDIRKTSHLTMPIVAKIKPFSDLTSMAKVWLGLGPKTTWLRLGNDRSWLKEINVTVSRKWEANSSLPCQTSNISPSNHHLLPLALHQCHTVS